jgi:hypothetical protein
MRRLDRGRFGLLLPLLGAGASLTTCLVFDGKTVPQPSEAIDSGTGESEAAVSAPPDPGIRCGANNWCSRDTVCCLKLGESGWFAPSTPCGAPGTCDGFSEFACDTASECDDGGVSSGESCCATRETAATEFLGSSCVPASACVPASTAVVLCTSDNGAACPPHQSCVEAGAADLPAGYYVCQATSDL